MNNINQLHYELHLILGCLKSFEKQLQNIQNMLNGIDFETMNKQYIKIACNQKIPNDNFNNIFEFLKIQIEKMETFLKENKQ
jgi:hypothetical protein